MRVGAFVAAQDFINAIAGKVQPNKVKGFDDPKTARLGFGEILCWAARVAGCILFVASFGAFVLPSIGFSWLEAGIVFVFAIGVSERLMNFYQVYYEFIGTCQLVWSKYKKHDSMRLWMLGGKEEMTES